MCLAWSLKTGLTDGRKIVKGRRFRYVPEADIWNVDHAAGTFSLYINGKAIAHLLEPFVPRDKPAYAEIRDEAMKVIAEVSTQSVLTIIEETGLMPDVLFAYYAEDI